MFWRDSVTLISTLLLTYLLYVYYKARNIEHFTLIRKHALIYRAMRWPISIDGIVVSTNSRSDYLLYLVSTNSYCTFYYNRTCMTERVAASNIVARLSWKARIFAAALYCIRNLDETCSLEWDHPGLSFMWICTRFVKKCTQNDFCSSASFPVVSGRRINSMEHSAIWDSVVTFADSVSSTTEDLSISGIIPWCPTLMTTSPWTSQ